VDLEDMTVLRAEGCRPGAEAVQALRCACTSAPD
jgi:hypothetical protein